ADAKAFLGLPRAEADHALDVLAEAGVSGAGVDAEALGGEEPSAKVALVLSAIATEPDELLVDLRPVGGGSGVGFLRTLAEKEQGGSTGLVGADRRIHVGLHSTR